MRSLTVVRYPWIVRARTCFLAGWLILAATAASAQTYGVQARARKHFVTVSYDWQFVEPLHFADHPLGDLLGREVASAQREQFEYRTRDEAILVDVLEFARRTHAAGVTVYPFGMSSGATLAVRGSVERLPDIRLRFVGPAPFAAYDLTGARALDGAVGVYMADRSPGWGLGSHAFVAAGLGRITSDLGGGSRYFAEGGGGLSVGPIGAELAVKFAWNRLDEPVEHTFLTVPISLRGTVTF
jgi:hypothetical protein